MESVFFTSLSGKLPQNGPFVSSAVSYFNSSQVGNRPILLFHISDFLQCFCGNDHLLHGQQSSAILIRQVKLLWKLLFSEKSWSPDILNGKAN